MFKLLNCLIFQWVHNQNVQSMYLHASVGLSYMLYMGYQMHAWDGIMCAIVCAICGRFYYETICTNFL